MNSYELPVTNLKPEKGEVDFLASEKLPVKEEGSLKMENADILTADELSAIRLRADLRRRSHELKMDLSYLQQASLLESVKAAYAGNIQKVNREASGEENISLLAAEAAEQHGQQKPKRRG